MDKEIKQKMISLITHLALGVEMAKIHDRYQAKPLVIVQSGKSKQMTCYFEAEDFLNDLIKLVGYDSYSHLISEEDKRIEAEEYKNNGK